MAKRKKNNKPDLPQATLERARSGVQADNDNDTAENKTAAQAREERAERRRERSSARRSTAEPIQYAARRKTDPNDSQTVQRMLANPTKFVSEEELHQEYGYVVNDIRNMFVLAGALMALLVLLAQFI